MSSDKFKDSIQSMSRASNSKKCLIHPTNDYMFLCTNPYRSDICFKCEECIVKQSLDGKNLLPIDQVEKSETDTIFYNWPFPEDYKFGEIIQAVANKKSDENILQEIVSFFEDFKMKVQKKIEVMQLQMEEKAKIFFNMSKKIVEDYNCLSKKEELKKIVSHRNSDIIEVSNNFKEIISDCYANQSASKERLKQKIDHMNQMEKSINFQEAKKQQDRILNSIGEIEFFLNPQEFASIDVPKQAKGNVDCLIDLINNKFNFISPPFLKEAKDLLEKCRGLIDQNQLCPVIQEGKEKIDIHLFEEHEEKEVVEFMKIILMKKKKGNLVSQNYWNSKKIYSLVSNRSNLCSLNQLDQLSKILKGVNFYLESFEIDNDVLPIDWEGINNGQLHYLGQIGNQLKKMNYQQNNVIQNRIFSLNAKEIEQFFESITQQFLPSKSYKESTQMKIENNDKNEIVITNTSNVNQQCYLRNQLKKNSNYIINLSINNIYDENAYFIFGLINEQNKDTKVVNESDNIFYSQYSGNKTTKIIKGLKMHTGDEKKIGKKSFEIQFNIEKRLFKISSSDKKNILELEDQNFFDPSKQYLFAILVCNQADQVIIHEIKEVDKFDELI